MPEVQEINSFVQTFKRHLGQQFRVEESFLSASSFRRGMDKHLEETEQDFLEPSVCKIWNKEKACWQYMVPASGETWYDSHYTQLNNVWCMTKVFVRGYEVAVSFVNELEETLFLKLKFGPGGCVDSVNEQQLETYPVRTNGVLTFINTDPKSLSLPHLTLLEVDASRRMLRYSVTRVLRWSSGYGPDPCYSFTEWSLAFEDYFKDIKSKFLKSVRKNPFWTWYSSVRHQLFNGLGKYTMTEFVHVFACDHFNRTNQIVWPGTKVKVLLGTSLLRKYFASSLFHFLKKKIQDLNKIKTPHPATDQSELEQSFIKKYVSVYRSKRARCFYIPPGKSYVWTVLPNNHNPTLPFGWREVRGNQRRGMLMTKTGLGVGIYS